MLIIYLIIPCTERRAKLELFIGCYHILHRKVKRKETKSDKSVTERFVGWDEKGKLIVYLFVGRLGLAFPLFSSKQLI